MAACTIAPDGRASQGAAVLRVGMQKRRERADCDLRPAPETASLAQREMIPGQSAAALE